MTVSHDQQQLLCKILKKNNYNYDEFMIGFHEGAFPSWKIDLLCDFINDEFMMQGLSDNDLPNEYGYRLEELIDKINRR